MTIDPLLDLSFRAALAAMLVWAAAHKLRDLPAFASVVREYAILPAALARPAAPAFAAMELVLAVGLLWTPSRVIASTGLGILLVAYSAAIRINLRRGRRNVDCGCFGPARRQPLSEWLLLRNTILIGAAVAIGLPVGDRSLAGLDALFGVAAVMSLALLWMAANQLLAQWPAVAALRRRA